MASDFSLIDFFINGELTSMKSYIFAALALFGVALTPAFAGAAEGCLGDETFTKFKSFTDGSIVVSSHEGGDYKLTLSQRPNNMPLTEKIKVRSTGECLAEGDDVVMTGIGGHRAKYKIVAVEQVAGAPTAAAPAE
jgi:hypothetical protein